MSVAIEVSAHSHTGLVRAVNEDSYLARHPVFVVADGMGGHARGDKASSEAVRVFDERIEHGSLPTPDDVIATVSQANAAVRGLSSIDDSGISVAGTTLTGVVLVQPPGDDAAYWMIINVGDSRVYQWDGRALTQLSVDHSAVQELVQSGLITADAASVHPERNVITRALGAADLVEADVWLIPVSGHQTFVVCSDGLCKEVDDAAIADILCTYADEDVHSTSVARALVDAALGRGGRDNVTVVVVESDLADEVQDSDITVDRGDTRSGSVEETRPRS